MSGASGAAQLWYDGAQENSSSAGVPYNATLSLIGQEASGLAGWDGDIAELIIYGVPLSDSERETVRDYLATKYAITIP